MKSSAETAVLSLLVRNHPGVMSHVCGLFARRAFNVDAIVCLPVGDGRRSRVLLQVADDERVDQLILQLRKLEDVLAVARAEELLSVFSRLAEAVGPLSDSPTFAKNAHGGEDPYSDRLG